MRILHATGAALILAAINMAGCGASPPSMPSTPDPLAPANLAPASTDSEPEESAEEAPADEQAPISCDGPCADTCGQYDDDSEKAECVAAFEAGCFDEPLPPDADCSFVTAPALRSEEAVQEPIKERSSKKGGAATPAIRDAAEDDEDEEEDPGAKPIPDF